MKGRRGWYACVLQEGIIKPGDTVTMLAQPFRQQQQQQQQQQGEQLQQGTQ